MGGRQGVRDWLDFGSYLREWGLGGDIGCTEEAKGDEVVGQALVRYGAEC